ncbi:Methyl-accepting chemotaxis protein McpB [Planctomycetes bacterium Pan216]|uniref:Methyl-accepting chemotaxis protein McpB n=1 Tax=Kolteria novifilia TaxID=2527975 RepID=A0A518B4E3_9BACT|nr:Methyl-accepting chemotaxis protein McpB [Planctomycetes bacterium Pan216]
MAFHISALRRPNIATRLAFWFLVIQVVSITIIILFIDAITTRSLEGTIRDNLIAISASKAAQIENYAREKIESTSAQTRNPYAVAAFEELVKATNASGFESPEFNEVIKRYTPYFEYYGDTFQFADVLLVSPEGKVLMTTRDSPLRGLSMNAGALEGTELSEVFDRARALLQTDISNFEIYPGIDDPAAFVAGPVIDDEGRLVGVLAMQISNKEIYGVLNDYTGLGATGETVVGSLEGDDVVIVAPVRNAEDIAFNTRARMGSDKMARLQAAVRGEKGFGLNEDYRGIEGIAVWSYLPSFRWGMVVKLDHAEAFTLIAHQRDAMIMIGVATLFPVFFLALMVARSISRPMQAAVHLAERVAAGDLTATADVQSRDEAGRLLTAINRMAANLNSLIGRVKVSSRLLTSVSKRTQTVAHHQEETVREFGTSTAEISAAAHQISATSEELLGSVTEVNQVANNTSKVAVAGRSSLSEMEAQMNQLRETTQAFTERLATINDKAAGITSVVTTISTVADQTNLLSVNATIEAEKAGEAGKGFRVVAREIRRLADQTAVSTLDIERMVKDMQSAVAEGAHEMDRFRDDVSASVREVDAIAGQLGKIIEPIQELTGRFAQVNEGMRSQSLGARQIRDAMQHLNDSAQRSNLAIDEFLSANEDLRDAVRGLNEEVSRFKVSVEDLPQDEESSDQPRSPSTRPSTKGQDSSVLEQVGAK